MKLREQFRRLYQLQLAHLEAVCLPELANAMHCSERNMRLLLSKMAAQQWLQWQAGRGRGNKSSLKFLINPDELMSDHLAQLLARGELELAFASLDEQQKQQLSKRLPDYLGIADQACRRLRMPLFRSPVSLDPLYAHARLESYLVRQIFSRLTYFDGNQKRLLPALAHHWESEQDGHCWHFWLRPDLSFHDGSKLDTEDVKQSLLRLRSQPAVYFSLYQHLQKIDTGPGGRISFYLSKADYLWPHLLATANASIVPRRRRSDFARQPIGSGAFRLVRNNPYQLTLQAFKDYYRERPLLDEIDLWVLSATADTSGLDLHYGYSCERRGDTRHLVRAEAGSAHIICNPQRNIFRLASQRLALADWLTPTSLFAADHPSRTHAFGLLSCWKHRSISAEPAQAAPFKRGTHLRMVSGQTAEMLELASKVKARLEQAGAVVEWRSLDFAELSARLWLDQTDIVLTREVMHDDVEFGCFEWFLCDSVFRRWMPPRSISQIDHMLDQIRASADTATRNTLLEQIARKLVTEAWLIPLSHEIQHISVAPHVAGARVTPFGFAALRDLWLKDNAPPITG